MFLRFGAHRTQLLLSKEPLSGEVAVRHIQFSGSRRRRSGSSINAGIVCVDVWLASFETSQIRSWMDLCGVASVTGTSYGRATRQDQGEEMEAFVYELDSLTCLSHPYIHRILKSRLPSAQLHISSETANSNGPCQSSSMSFRPPVRSYLSFFEVFFSAKAARVLHSSNSTNHMPSLEHRNNDNDKDDHILLLYTKMRLKSTMVQYSCTSTLHDAQKHCALLTCARVKQCHLLE
jgi:hypothetical protein